MSATERLTIERDIETIAAEEGGRYFRLPPKISYKEWLKQREPRLQWDWPHQQPVFDAIDNITSGRGPFKYIFSMPPRHGKSTLITERLPAYWIEQYHHHRVMCGAYAMRLARRFSRRNRSIFDGEIQPDQNQADYWETTGGGGYIATGVGGGVTGHGAEAILIDDPVKSREEANSPVYRERCWNWYIDDVLTRAEPGCWQIIVMTRWHFDDLAGRLIETDPDGWQYINLPAIAERDDVLGREPGEALCPERFNEEWLLERKRIMGSSFEALYQGNPVPVEGGTIKRRWFRYYESDPYHPNYTKLPEFERIVQSVDCANKAGELNDHSVCTTWGIYRRRIYLLDVWRKRVDYPELKRATVENSETWKADVVLIEDKGNGIALIQDLKNDATVSVIPVTPISDKATRLSNESIAYETGDVYHPRKAPWLATYEAELLRMPATDEDDQADSTSQLLAWARGNTHDFRFDSAGKRSTAEIDTGDIDTDHGFGRVTRRSDSSGF